MQQLNITQKEAETLYASLIHFPTEGNANLLKKLQNMSDQPSNEFLSPCGSSLTVEKVSLTIPTEIDARVIEFTVSTGEENISAYLTHDQVADLVAVLAQLVFDHNAKIELQDPPALSPPLQKLLKNIQHAASKTQDAIKAELQSKKSGRILHTLDIPSFSVSAGHGTEALHFLRREVKSPDPVSGTVTTDQVFDMVASGADNVTYCQASFGRDHALQILEGMAQLLYGDCKVLIGPPTPHKK